MSKTLHFGRDFEDEDPEIVNGRLLYRQVMEMIYENLPVNIYMRSKGMGGDFVPKKLIVFDNELYIDNGGQQKASGNTVFVRLDEEYFTFNPTKIDRVFMKEKPSNLKLGENSQKPGSY